MGQTKSPVLVATMDHFFLGTVAEPWCGFSTHLDNELADEDALATETPELQSRTELLGGATRYSPISEGGGEAGDKDRSGGVEEKEPEGRWTTVKTGLAVEKVEVEKEEVEEEVEEERLVAS